MEANPTSVEAARFEAYRAAGINRVSLGVQALDDDALRALGRLHSAQEALAAVAIARTIFDRYSFDLIYARPGQTRRRRARRACPSRWPRPPSICRFICSSIEPETLFWCFHAAGKPMVPDGRPARDLYGLRPRRSAMRRVFRPTRSPTTRAPAPSAGTTSSTGAYGNTPASVLAPIRLDIGSARCHRRDREARPEAWLARVEADRPWSVSSDDEPLRSEANADEFLLMGHAACRRDRACAV